MSVCTVELVEEGSLIIDVLDERGSLGTLGLLEDGKRIFERPLIPPVIPPIEEIGYFLPLIRPMRVTIPFKIDIFRRWIDRRPFRINIFRRILIPLEVKIRQFSLSFFVRRARIDVGKIVISLREIRMNLFKQIALSVPLRAKKRFRLIELLLEEKESSRRT